MRDAVQGKLENVWSSFRRHRGIWRDCQKKKQKKKRMLNLPDRNIARTFLWQAIGFKTGSLKIASFTMGKKNQFQWTVNEPVLFPQFFMPFSFYSLITLTFYIVEVTVIVLANFFLCCLSFRVLLFFFKDQQVLSSQWDYRTFFFI